MYEHSNENNNISPGKKVALRLCGIASIFLLIAAFAIFIFIYLVTTKYILELLITACFLWFFSLLFMVIFRVFDRKSRFAKILMFAHIFVFGLVIIVLFISVLLMIYHTVTCWNSCMNLG